ncbi:MAG: response regulator [Acidobacteriota bacterium]
MKAGKLPVTQAQSPAAGRVYRVLVVEDDPAISRLVTKLLTREHIRTEVAADGDVATSLLQSVDYDVVIFDLMVPGATGFELIELVRDKVPRPQVAVVSAVSHQSLTLLDLDIVKLVIAKPFDVDEFTKAILTLCAESDAMSS